MLHRLKDRFRQRLLQRGVLVLEGPDLVRRRVPLRVAGQPVLPRVLGSVNSGPSLVLTTTSRKIFPQ